MQKSAKILAVTLALALAAFPALAQGLELIMNSRTTSQAFAGPKPSDQQIQQILEAGIVAPSARNQQPWHFTVVKDSELVTAMTSKEGPGAVAIVVSAYQKGDTAAYAVFDCGLATQNMNLAAQALGLGAHIYGTGVAAAGGQYRQQLGIPEGYQPVVLLVVGTLPREADGVSGATARSRNSLADVVNYVD